MIESLLQELELALKKNNLWSSSPPSTQAFASQAPFCYDTMSFEQWLQFVFIFKIKLLLSQNAALPKGAQITPMAEQTLSQYQDIILVISKIDKALR